MQLSIVVPVYNVKQYLPECLKSLYSLQNVKKEIILVDDGSTDNSSLIINEFFKMYTDETVIVTQKNKGLSGARNAGFSKASGDYVVFIDSDDYVDSEKLGELYDNAVKFNLDICVGDYIKFYEDGQPDHINVRKLKCNEKLQNYGILNGKEFIEKSFDGREVEVIACRSIIKREFLLKHTPVFVEGLLHEDSLFTFGTFFYANRVRFFPIKFYYYRQRSGSIMSSISQKNFRAKMYIANELLEMMIQNEINSLSWNCVVVAMYSFVVRRGKIKNTNLYNKIKKIKRLTMIGRIQKTIIPIFSMFANEEDIYI